VRLCMHMRGVVVVLLVLCDSGKNMIQLSPLTEILSTHMNLSLQSCKQLPSVCETTGTYYTPTQLMYISVCDSVCDDTADHNQSMQLNAVLIALDQSICQSDLMGTSH
jgi:hypothetical protein